MKFPYLAFVLILSLALAGCGWNPFHRMYSATAEIQIRSRGTPSIASPSSDGVLNFSDDATRLATDIEIMQSEDALTPVIQELKLDQIWAKRFMPDERAFSPQQALDHLRKVLKFERLTGTDIVKITAFSELPQEAADIANAVADSYKALRDREEAERTGRGEDSLHDQIAQQQKVVAEAKAAVVKVRQNLGGIVLTTGPSQLIDANSALIPFRDAQRYLDQQQSLLDALNIRLSEVIADAQITESPVRILARAVAPPE